MVYKFSETSKKALEIAEKIAIELGHNLIGSEHILYGVLCEKEGLGYKILKKQNINAMDVYNKIKEVVGEEKVILSRTEGFTPKSKKIIEESFKEMERSDSTNIGTENLLMGIINDKDNIGYKILVDLNTDIDKVYDEILKISEQIQELSKEKKNNEKTKEKLQTLNQYGTNLNNLAEKGKIDDLIGRDKEVERVIQILSRRTKNNPCLIGEPGVGKTAIVEGLAKRIVNKTVPEILRNKIIFNLDLTSMIAGAKYRGDFEERIKKCLNEVRKSNDIILFIDEIHTIVGAGAAEGAIDAANILKPILARGEIQLIGATTIDEYTKYIEKDAALERRFCPINVNEPSLEETIIILKGIREKYEKYHNVKISDELINECVQLGDRYIYDRYMPDKAIDLLDEVSSRAKMKAHIMPESLKNLEEEILEIKKQKNIAIENQDFEKAAKLRDNEIEKNNFLIEEEEKWRNKNIKTGTVILVEDLRELVSELTGIPINQISESENDKLLNLEKELEKRIIGQNEAIYKISKSIIRGRLGINNPKKPIGSFLFLGPTGVGKTELSKALAESIFGNEDSIIKLDMSEYMEKHSISKIIGSPPGYIGFEEETNLAKKVRKNPYSIIVFDEIEKAHPDVLNILLQVLDEGVLTDSSGRKISFKNTIIIMTSNIGANRITNKRRLGFSNENESQLEEKILLEELKKEFNPEFINRIDNIITFRKLENKDLIKIIDIILEKLQKRLLQKKIYMEVSKDVKEYIVNNEIDYNYGARQLEIKIKEIIEDKIANEIIERNLKNGDTIKFYLEEKRVKAKIN